MGQKVKLPVAVKRTGLSENTIRRRVAEGHLRAYQVPGTRGFWFDTDDLDALFQPVSSGGAV